MLRKLLGYYKTTWRYFWIIWCAPGYALLWITYYYPTEWGKGRNVVLTGRQMRKSYIFAPINSFFLLIFVGFISLSAPALAIPHAFFLGFFLLLFTLPIFPVWFFIYFLYDFEAFKILTEQATILLPF